MYAVEMNGLWIGQDIYVSYKYNYGGTQRTKTNMIKNVKHIQHHPKYGVFLSNNVYSSAGYNKWYAYDAEVELVEK